MTTKTMERTRRIAMTALLAALTVVLQVICTFIRFGPISLTLALTPIIIGAAIYGVREGAVLGFVFSATVYVMGLMGLDGGFVQLMMSYSAVGTTAVCLLKGTAAGAVAALIFKACGESRPTLSTLAASAAAPIVNTGLFALATVSIFGDMLSDLAGSADPIPFLLTGMIGINFIVEFAVNVALGTTVSRIIHIYRIKYGKASTTRSAFEWKG